MGKPAVVVDNVSMKFNLSKEKVDNLKDYLIKFIKKEIKYNEFWALQNVNFEVQKGDRVGILGLNGAGKSTLLKVIAGVFKPTEGKVIKNGRLVPLLELGAGFDPQYTGRENIYLYGAMLGYSKSFIEEKFDEIVEFSELKEFIDVPIKNYSSGMKARLGFSIATLVSPDILILDEVLSVGDAKFRKKSEKKVLSMFDKGYEPGKDFVLAMDAASSEWKGSQKGEYVLPKCGKKFTSSELVEHWKNLIEKYPIYSIEDGLDEEDWEGWQIMTKELGGKVQLVGDDLFVTNTERLEKGISLGCGNSILIKLNQIGSVSETLEAIKMAHKAGYTAISSHRSGETEDTTIADLAVALNTCQIKTGAPSRSERVAKYNQLLRIEEELGDAAVYPGFKAFNIKR